MSLYNSREWRKARAAHLSSQPLCVFCEKRGLSTPATVVDHITPHKGDSGLFWDRDNWQSLCKLCHDSTKARIERGQVHLGCGKDGMPIDHEHHWSTGAVKNFK